MRPVEISRIVHEAARQSGIDSCQMVRKARRIARVDLLPAQRLIDRLLRRQSRRKAKSNEKQRCCYAFHLRSPKEDVNCSFAC